MGRLKIAPIIYSSVVSSVVSGVSSSFSESAVNLITYFSDISEEIREEYLANIYSEETFNYYDEFLNDSSKYIELKKKYIEILHS